MKKSKIMWRILKRTGTIHLLYGFIGFFAVISIIIMLIEPDIQSLSDSVWYCFALITTIGFGDITVHTIIGRILSIILSLYSVMIIAIIPGVVTSYYIESIKLKSNESVEKFLYDLERLPELSKEELANLSEKVKKVHKEKRNK